MQSDDETIHSTNLGLIIRSLTSSDLGLFFAQRPHLHSKQRALNFNSAIVEKILDLNSHESGEVYVRCQYLGDTAAAWEMRPLRKTGKNWRFGGPAIRGASFEIVKPGDFFVSSWAANRNHALSMKWKLICQATEPETHKQLKSLVSADLHDAMLSVELSDSNYGEICTLVAFGSNHAPREMPNAVTDQSQAPLIEAEQGDRPIRVAPPKPRRHRSPEQQPEPSVRERLKSPHIMEEMYRVAGELSGPAQKEFFEVVTLLAEQFRSIMTATQRLGVIKKDHVSAWQHVRGKLVAHVDGGMANLPALGSAPIAIRVGTYLVRPGQKDPDREQFSITPQLVDEMFSIESGGIYKHRYPDLGAVRDTARIAMETAGAVTISKANPELAILLMHGALVNPVSRYSDMDDEEGNTIPFPEFSEKALDILLPGSTVKPTGDDAQFIPVHLEQLKALNLSNAIVCGVVERPGFSTSVSTQIIKAIPDWQLTPLISENAEKWRSWFESVCREFRIGDELLFRCVLKPGEFTTPQEIDRNEARRRPRKWFKKIGEYPKPYISYMLPSEWAGPIRAEVFEKDISRFSELAEFLMHSSLLLPGYAFPVGLDTVDKFAKVPNWMGRPISSRAIVSAFRQALDAGDTDQIDLIRHILAGTQRDFFFRPKA